jgi:hypothetical protein
MLDTLNDTTRLRLFSYSFPFYDMSFIAVAHPIPFLSEMRKLNSYQRIIRPPSRG